MWVFTRRRAEHDTPEELRSACCSIRYVCVLRESVAREIVAQARKKVLGKLESFGEIH